MKYEKWSPGYWLLKQYVRFADWLIHKKIIVTGKEKIPDNKPIVFAPNHQNALSDPMAILLHIRFQPVWLARADIFGKSKVVDSILRFMKIMPVYRLQDGKENLAKNDDTFNQSIKVLENNFALALFPEAAHSFKRQMMVHKKAVPRIVFMAEEKTGNQLDIQIIPAGIFYSHYWKFNRTVIVQFGDPVSVNDYLEIYSQNQNAAIILLKTKIHDAILPLILNIRSKKYYEEFERIREIYGRHFLKRQNKEWSLLNLFHSDQKLTNKLDELETTHPDETENLVRKANDFYGNVKMHGLRSWMIAENENHANKLVLHSLLLIAGLPLFLYGFVFNAIPFFLVDRLVRKKVKNISFWSTFFLVGGIVIFPLFYLVTLLTVSGVLPGFLLKIAFLVSLPFAGKLAFNWYILLRKTMGRFRLLRLKRFKKESYKDLIGAKEQLFNQLDGLILP
jgi:1-acyl-sn-glycerol-3-phosphate acyltransferase